MDYNREWDFFCQAWPLVLKSGVTPLTTDKFVVSKWRVLVTELSAP